MSKSRLSRISPAPAKLDSVHFGPAPDCIARPAALWSHLTTEGTSPTSKQLAETGS
jgi:hypothetical protein